MAIVVDEGSSEGAGKYGDVADGVFTVLSRVGLKVVAWGKVQTLCWQSWRRVAGFGGR